MPNSCDLKGGKNRKSKKKTVTTSTKLVSVSSLLTQLKKAVKGKKIKI